MNTLEHRWLRLNQELIEAQNELQALKRSGSSDRAMINFYQDLIGRNRETISHLDTHVNVQFKLACPFDNGDDALNKFVSSC